MKEYALDILFERRFAADVSIIDYFWHRATPKLVQRSRRARLCFIAPLTLTDGPTETEGTYLIVETDGPEPYVFTYCPRRNAWWHPGQKQWTPA